MKRAVKEVAAGFWQVMKWIGGSRPYMAFMTWLVATTVASLLWGWPFRTQLELQGGAFLLYVGYQWGGMRGYGDGLREGSNIAMRVMNDFAEQHRAGVERRN